MTKAKKNNRKGVGVVKKDSAHTHTPQSLLLQLLGFSLKKHSILHKQFLTQPGRKRTVNRAEFSPLQEDLIPLAEGWIFYSNC